MSARTLVMAVGVLVVAVSVLADVLGVGGRPGFGWKQGLGVAVGLALVAVGIAWRRLSR